AGLASGTFGRVGCNEQAELVCHFICSFGLRLKAGRPAAVSGRWGMTGGSAGEARARGLRLSEPAAKTKCRGWVFIDYAMKTPSRQLLYLSNS
ncbi:MAG: hypothetical protein LBE49_02835, partial [Deltaproteobacteria bacterium]|nr:hypothetical protein [Deltaproteobacteria bacterium]